MTDRDRRLADQAHNLLVVLELRRPGRLAPGEVIQLQGRLADLRERAERGPGATEDDVRWVLGLAQQLRDAVRQPPA